MCKAHSNTDGEEGIFSLFFLQRYIFCIARGVDGGNNFFFFQLPHHKLYISLSDFCLPYMPFVMSPKTTFTIVSSRLHIFYTNPNPPFFFEIKTFYIYIWNDFKGRRKTLMFWWHGDFLSPVDGYKKISICSKIFFKSHQPQYHRGIFSLSLLRMKMSIKYFLILKFFLSSAKKLKYANNFH